MVRARTRCGIHAGEPTPRPALRPPGWGPPYLPVTRRYVNPLYLRVELIPEYAYLAPERLAEVSRAAEVLTAELNTDKQLDRDQSWKHKRDALLAIHKGRVVAGSGQPNIARTAQQKVIRSCSSRRGAPSLNTTARGITGLKAVPRSVESSGRRVPL